VFSCNIVGCPRRYDRMLICLSVFLQLKSVTVIPARLTKPPDVRERRRMC